MRDFWTTTKIAGEDLELYEAVRLSGSNKVVKMTTTGATSGFDVGPLGVVVYPGLTGQSVAVAYVGEARGIAGATIAEGKALTCNSAGHLVAAASGDIAFARALHAAVDLDHVDIILTGPYRFVGTN